MRFLSCFGLFDPGDSTDALIESQKAASGDPNLACIVARSLRELGELSQSRIGVSLELAQCIRRCLEASDTQLYGFDDSGGQSGCLVLLASCRTASQLQRCNSNNALLPGWSVALGPVAQFSSTRDADELNSTDRLLWLLHRAVTSKTAVTAEWRNTTSPESRSAELIGSASEGQAMPCALLCAALPLTLGDRLVGVLAVTARTQDVAARAFLSSSSALQQLALSASLALTANAAGVGPGSSCSSLGRLAASLRRLADSSSLQALIWELREALVQFVRQQYLLDMVVQIALVPQPDSRVAFMLQTHAPPPPVPVPGSGGHAHRSGGVLALTEESGSAVPQAAAVAALAKATGSGGGFGGYLSSDLARHVSKSFNYVSANQGPAEAFPKYSAAAAQRPPTAALLTGGGSLGGLPARLLSKSKVPMAALSPAAQRSSRVVQLLPGGGAATTPQAAQVPTGSLDAAAVAAAAAAAVSSASVTAVVESNEGLVADQVPALGARPFLLSQTLLQGMVAAGVEGEPGGAAAAAAGVRTGEQVADCARWVQDVRKPTRDVYLVMASGAGAGQAWSGFQGIPAASEAAKSSGSTGNSGGGGSDGAAVQSLSLLGLDAGSGSVLGLYLGFETQLPMQLLQAVTHGCSLLLQQVAAPVRAKLQGELAPELGTVLAGVPGSYASFAPSPAPQQPFADPITAVHLIPSIGTAAAIGLNASTAGAVMQPSRLARTTTMASCASQISAAELLEDELLGTSRSSVLELATELAGDGSAAQTGSKVRRTSRVRVPQLPAAPGSNAAMPTAAGGSGGGGGGDGGGDGDGDDDGVAAGGDNPHAQLTDRLAASCLGCLGSGRSSSLQRPHVQSSSTQLSPFQVQLQLPAGQLLGMGSSGGAPHHVAAVVALPAALMLSQDVPPAVEIGALTSVLTVHEIGDESSMRAHLGLLVESIMGTLRSNALGAAAEDAGRMGRTRSGLVLSSGAGGGYDVGLEAGSDLGELQLHEILGSGASGVVMRGVLGTTPVAVKLMELFDTESSPDEEEAVESSARRGGDKAPARGQQQGGTAGGGGGPPAAAAAPAEALRLEARRSMLRNAMELAVLRSVTHINIVQCHAVYDNVQLDRVKTHDGGTYCVLRRRRDGGSEGAPGAAEGTPEPLVVTAIVTELCAAGSLADALTDRSFPRRLATKAHAGGGAAFPPSGQAASVVVRVDMRGVYLTLLDIALALRHLHARRLVHRDVKPANVLLKESPTDPRGWTCKLADFGFALVLDRQAPVVGATEPTAVGPPASAPSHSCGRAGAIAAAGSRSGGPPRPSSQGSIHATLAAAAMAASPQAQRSGGGDGHADTVWYTVQEQACGTVTHMAPEAMKRNSRIDASADIFSFGVIMWELLCGRGSRPYARLHHDDILRAVVAGVRPIFKDEVPPAYRRLAQACWAADPASRPRATDLVAMVKAQLAALSSTQQQRQQAGGRRDRSGF